MAAIAMAIIEWTEVRYHGTVRDVCPVTLFQVHCTAILASVMQR